MRPLRFVDLKLRDTPDLQAPAGQALKLADWVKVDDEEVDRLLGWFSLDSAAQPAAALCGLRGAVPDDPALIDFWRGKLGLNGTSPRAAPGPLG